MNRPFFWVLIKTPYDGACPSMQLGFLMAPLRNYRSSGSFWGMVRLQSIFNMHLEKLFYHFAPTIIRAFKKEQQKNKKWNRYCSWFRYWMGSCPLWLGLWHHPRKGTDAGWVWISWGTITPSRQSISVYKNCQRHLAVLKSWIRNYKKVVNE